MDTKHYVGIVGGSVRGIVALLISALFETEVARSKPRSQTLIQLPHRLQYS